MRFVMMLSRAAFVLAMAATFCASGAAQARQSVVVELFTSEGCSSCPPADALISQLSKKRTAVDGIELILLGEHVEYWNGQGWRDRFSGPTYTQRQYDYVQQLHLATPYTPQAIIDGHTQTSGGNASALQQLITESARTPKSAKITIEPVAPDKWKVSVAEAGNRKLKVIVGVTEDNLETRVGGGENGGRTLKHDAVVRELDQVGTVTNGQFEKIVSTHSKSDWKQDDLRAIVIVQDADSGEIHGAASTRWQGAMASAPGH
jgi:hypothetical protein